MIAISKVGSLFNTPANSRKDCLAALLNVEELNPKRIPESKVTFTAANPLLSVICSTCAPSILAASSAFLSIFRPINAPAVPPTAVPIAAPIAAPLPLPAIPPIIAPKAAPEPPPIIPPLAVLFIDPQLPNTKAILRKKAINLIFFILLINLLVINSKTRTKIKKYLVMPSFLSLKNN